MPAHSDTVHAQPGSRLWTRGWGRVHSLSGLNRRRHCSCCQLISRSGALTRTATVPFRASSSTRCRDHGTLRCKTEQGDYSDKLLTERTAAAAAVRALLMRTCRARTLRYRTGTVPTVLVWLSCSTPGARAPPAAADYPRRLPAAGRRRRPPPPLPRPRPPPSPAPPQTRLRPRGCSSRWAAGR